MPDSSPGQMLREAVAGATIQVPGAFNALVGRLIEQAGYDAAYLSGAALSAGMMALPDVGLFTLNELVAQTAFLTRSVTIPVIVDADTGFGETMNVERTVGELEVAGAAGIQLEDQRLPKRCGHLSGKTLVETAEMCGENPGGNFGTERFQFGDYRRTDARGVTSVDDAITRASVFGSGADWIFPEAPAGSRGIREVRPGNRRSIGGEYDRVRPEPFAHAG